MGVVTLPPHFAAGKCSFQAVLAIGIGVLAAPQQIQSLPGSGNSQLFPLCDRLNTDIFLFPLDTPGSPCV